MKKNKGAFLVIVLMLSVVLLILAGALYTFAALQAKQARGRIYTDKAAYANTSGIRYAANRLANLVPTGGAYKTQYIFDLTPPTGQDSTVQTSTRITCAGEYPGKQFMDSDGTTYSIAYRAVSASSMYKGRVVSGSFVPERLLAQNKQAALILIRPARAIIPYGTSNPGRAKIITLYDEYK